MVCTGVHGLAASLWLHHEERSLVAFATRSAPAAWAGGDGEGCIGRPGHWASPAFVRSSGAALVVGVALWRPADAHPQLPMGQRNSVE